jgi:ABC-type antimicrobial peptide transport system permease subunit
LLLIAIGLASGLAAALAFGRVVESLLYRISPRDPVTLIVIAALLLLVSVVACWVPARRATKVDPLIALRSE